MINPLLRYIVTLMIGLGPVSGLASSIEFSGIVSSDLSWSADTVYITGNVVISNDATLTIAAGCKVIMAGFYKWNVNGAIQAYGTAAEPVYFTSNDTLDFWDFELGNAGWKGMVFEYVDAANDSTVFEHCVFSYVKKGGDGDNPISALHILFSDKIRVSHCLITQNYNLLGCPGITLFGASIKVLHSTFTGNSGDIGGCIALLSGAEPLIHGNTFTANYAKRNGGAITSQSAFPIITNNFFFNNHIQLSDCGPADGGGAIRCTNGTIAYIANNVFANNEAGSKGGALECLYDSHSIIENNTVVFNHGVLGGGGLYLFESSPILRNTVFWGNTRFSSDIPSQIFFFTEDAEPVIDHCVFQGGTEEFLFATDVTYAGNVNTVYAFDPQFNAISGGSGIAYDGAGGDWRLQSGSPCIDMGSFETETLLPLSDAWGGIRFSSTAIDIGAHEFFDGEFNQLRELTNDHFLLYPNPSTGMVYVVSYQPGSPIQVYAADGRHVLTTSDNQFRLEPGFYLITCGPVSKKLRVD